MTLGRNIRVISNRANAQLSTGPKTEAGKAASSQNAIRHGLTSKQVVIPGEDPAEYDAHRADLIETLQPANPIEAGLVEELAANSWRLKRAHRIETAVLTQIVGKSSDPDKILAMSFLDRPKELDRLVRYMTSIERSYWRVFNKLEAIQKARREQERQNAMERSYIESLKRNQARKNESGGFVSKSTETPVVLPTPEPAHTVAVGQPLPAISNS